MNYRNYENAELLNLEASLDYHDPDLVAEICDRAGLSEAYTASTGESSADGVSFESVLDRALEILGL